MPADVIQMSKVERLDGRWCLMVMGPFGPIVQGGYTQKAEAEAALKAWRQYERKQRHAAA